MNAQPEKTEKQLNDEAAARVRTPAYRKKLARRWKNAAKWHATHED